MYFFVVTLNTGENIKVTISHNVQTTFNLFCNLIQSPSTAREIMIFAMDIVGLKQADVDAKNIKQIQFRKDELVLHTSKYD